MGTIGLFYAAESEQTPVVAQKIKETFNDINIQIIPVETASVEDLNKYDNLIIGVSTWAGGKLPVYWSGFVDQLDKTDFIGKRIALFALGDQINYPHSFADSLGILADALQSKGAQLVGFTSTEGYQFDESMAAPDGRFKGLVIDTENQPNLTEERVQHWVDQLKKEFY